MGAYRLLRSEPLTIENGWIVRDGGGIRGYSLYSEIWKIKRGSNITKNDPGRIGPNRTEDMALLTDAMLKYGYPALEHQYGLWFNLEPGEAIFFDQEIEMNDKPVFATSDDSGWLLYLMEL